MRYFIHLFTGWILVAVLAFSLSVIMLNTQELNLTLTGNETDQTKTIVLATMVMSSGLLFIGTSNSTNTNNRIN